MLERYVDQVRLLLSVLPDIVREKVFALKGGTAINLFYRDMPRLSVDIDLTYLPVDDRETSLKDIDETLDRIMAAIINRRPHMQAQRIAGSSNNDRLSDPLQFNVLGPCCKRVSSPVRFDGDPRTPTLNGVHRQIHLRSEKE